jgi:hypothetical protein
MSRLTMTRGDRKVFNVTLTDAAGDPLDLTDLELTFTVKERHEDTVAVISKTVGAGIAVVSAEDGTATITVDPEDTEDIEEPRNFVWDLEVSNGAGDIRTPVDGTFRIRHDVTRPVGS